MLPPPSPPPGVAPSRQTTTNPGDVRPATETPLWRLLPVATLRTAFALPSASKLRALMAVLLEPMFSSQDTTKPPLASPEIDGNASRRRKVLSEMSVSPTVLPSV